MRVSARLIAPLVLIAAVAAVWWFGLASQLSWATLAREQASLQAWVIQNPIAAGGLYVAIYIASVTLSLPQAALLTMTGGLLFGTVAGGMLAVTGATIGAILLFAIARHTFADPLARRGGTALGTLRDELRRDGFSYLLAIRLIPVVPFLLVNLAAALCGMRLRDFAAATFIGIMPATFIFASIGAGLGLVLAAGQTPDLRILISHPILGPLLALAVLSVLPPVWRKWRARHA